jgi:predicted hotdog family 3-hydroxylacyl-ACP dehydratase
MSQPPPPEQVSQPPLPPVAALVPHAPPMLWIDEIVQYTDESVVCRVTLRDEHVFLDQGQAESIVTVELMAQAVAAFVGLADRVRGETPRPGYLVAIPEARFLVPTVAVGQTLELVCSKRFGDDKIASFACVARHGAVPVADAIINVVRPDAGMIQTQGATEMAPV